ncbi:kinase-like protein [Mycena latifolia]|nr:kinase-like protein [Mycena latifolia]
MHAEKAEPEDEGEETEKGVHRDIGRIPAAVASFEDFIDEAEHPRDFYCDLQEIAKGESGSVYSAALIPTAPLHRLKLPSLVHARDIDDGQNGRRALVALLPGGSQQLRGARLPATAWAVVQMLGIDALYVGLAEDSLWIRMELTERSLANVVSLDVVSLVNEDLQLAMARLANDLCRAPIYGWQMLLALDFLQQHNIAHRELRSDNSLLNSEGVLKPTDFSNKNRRVVRTATDLAAATPPFADARWQRAERGPSLTDPALYPSKIDVWSVGATDLAWQRAERWPPLTEPPPSSPAFRDFLRQWSQRAASRTMPQTPFPKKASGRRLSSSRRCTYADGALDLRYGKWNLERT